MRNIQFTQSALAEFHEWLEQNPKIGKKTFELISECAKSPFEGKGKPEALKHNLKGKWSRRITDEHRLVYEVTDSLIIVFACKYHY